MELRQAANYFSHTEVDGWTGRTWSRLDYRVTLLPYDRFISEREFGNKRRQMLCDPDATCFDRFTVIRTLPEKLVYILGTSNYDMREQAYSRVQLVLLAPYIGEIISFQPTVMASGVGSSLQPVSGGRWHCDVERVTFANSKEFDATRFSEVVLSFPRDCPVDTDYEVKVNDKVYDVRETYLYSGFKLCRAYTKRPPP